MMWSNKCFPHESKILTLTYNWVVIKNAIILKFRDNLRNCQFKLWYYILFRTVVVSISVSPIYWQIASGPVNLCCSVFSSVIAIWFCVNSLAVSAPICIPLSSGGTLIRDRHWKCSRFFVCFTFVSVFIQIVILYCPPGWYSTSVLDLGLGKAGGLDVCCRFLMKLLLYNSKEGTNTWNVTHQ